MYKDKIKVIYNTTICFSGQIAALFICFFGEPSQDGRLGKNGKASCLVPILCCVLWSLDLGVGVSFLH